jgi:hypothetical protein
MHYRVEKYARAPRDLVGRLVIEADSRMLLTFDRPGMCRNDALSFSIPSDSLAILTILGPLRRINLPPDVRMRLL